MSVNFTEIIVKPDDIDLLNHVNNIVYIEYLEKARLNWYDSIDMNLKVLMKRGLAVVVRKLEILYINEARLGDVLKVETIPTQMGRSSFVIKQVIYNQYDQVITKAEAVSVMIDLEKRKSTSLIDEIAKYFKPIIKEV